MSMSMICLLVHEYAYTTQTPPTRAVCPLFLRVAGASPPRMARAVEGAGERMTSSVRVWGYSTDPGLQLSSQVCGVKRDFAPSAAPGVRLGSCSRRARAALQFPEVGAP